MDAIISCRPIKPEVKESGLQILTPQDITDAQREHLAKGGIWYVYILCNRQYHKAGHEHSDPNFVAEVDQM